MEVGVATLRHSHVARRAAPLLCGGAIVASAGFLAAHDPAAAGSPFPPCAFHQATGLWCPGCGLTRGIYQLLHGHLGSAISYNIFTPLVALAAALAWVAWVGTAWGAQPIRLPRRTGRWLGIVLPAMAILYGIVRNVPVAPLQALAP